MKLKIRSVWWDDERDHLGRTEVCRSKAVLVEDLQKWLKARIKKYSSTSSMEYWEKKTIARQLLALLEKEEK